MAVKKVFLSSTGKDLSEYREAVYAALGGLDDCKCVRMEDFGARSGVALQACVDKVRECDLFIGITGHCYGSVPRGQFKSFTEFEYDIATGLPRLMFVAPEGFLFPANLIESTTKRRKQKAFRKRVAVENVVKEFDSPSRLAEEVLKAVRNWERERREMPAYSEPRTEALLHAEEPQAPPFKAPSAPYYASRYSLERNFTGRWSERARMTEWFVSDSANVLAIESIGGMGKTSLAWVWLQTDVLCQNLENATPLAPIPDESRPKGVFWWTFTGDGGRFSRFVDRALEYFGEHPFALDSPRAKIRALLAVLDSDRHLLVLDGFERELKGYSELVALGDEEELTKREPEEPRSCVDPLASAFLQNLGGAPLKSRTLFTTQLVPKELDRAACFSLERLKGLCAEDTEALFCAEGIEADRSEVDRVCAPFDYHPLSLRLLIGLIKNDPEYPNDIRAISDADLMPELQKGHGAVELSLQHLTPIDLSLLCFLAAFRFPVDYPTLEAINPLESKISLKQGLSRLLDRRLVSWDDESGTYDLHPIVRKCAYQKLPDPKEIHKKLREYFERFSGEVEGVVASLSDLSWTIELYHHTVRAGNYDEARDQLAHHLVPDPLDYLFGAYPIILELLRELFPDGEHCDPPLKQAAEKVWALGELANAYSMTGHPALAQALFEKLFAIQRSLSESSYFARALFNHAHLQMLVGNMRSAEDRLRSSIRVGKLIESPLESAIGHQELGRLYSFMGLYKKAGQELERARSMFGRLKRLQPQAVVEAYHCVRNLLMKNPEQGLLHAMKSRILAEQRARVTFPVERDFVRADWLRGWAALEMAEHTTQDRRDFWLAEAELHLGEGLPRCRRNGLISLEPNILLASARCRRLMEDRERSVADAEKALSIANRCDYRFKQADIHNFLARLAFDERNTEMAKHHAEIAKERALCDGPPHYYVAAFEESERLLAEANAI